MPLTIWEALRLWKTGALASMDRNHHVVHVRFFIIQPRWIPFAHQLSHIGAHLDGTFLWAVGVRFGCARLLSIAFDCLLLLSMHVFLSLVPNFIYEVLDLVWLEAVHFILHRTDNHVGLHCDLLCYHLLLGVTLSAHFLVVLDGLAVVHLEILKALEENGLRDPHTRCSRLIVNRFLRTLLMKVAAVLSATTGTKES